MNLVDTHCHIHDRKLFSETEAEAALEGAIKAEVHKLLLIGTSLEDSKAAIRFAEKHPQYCWASIGIHPHEAKDLTATEITKHLAELKELATHPKVVAIGECGFDFFYNNRAECLHKQILLLEGQLKIAQNYTLPVSFHVREAFSEFWPVFIKFDGIKGVLHSFTDTRENLQRALEHKLFIGVNGIATFTTHNWQLEQFKTMPLKHIVLETDAPFLTPKPKRGTINLPENVTYITKFLADLRGEDDDLIAEATTANAKKLFRFF